MKLIQRDAVMKISNDVDLLCRLWHPDGEGPWPALLMRQPYGRAIASTITYAHPSWWAKQGYLVVIQDVRGQGDSGGVFQGFSQEANDTAATHTWVKSLNECNGKLGCYGFSYQGLTQLLAPSNTEPPDCLSPAMSGLDERLHWSCEGGAHWWHLGLSWGLQLAALQVKRRKDYKAWDEIRCCLEDQSYLNKGLELLKKHDPDGMAFRWLQSDPLQKDSWRIHKVPETWLRRPLLLIGGWWDPHLLGIIDLWKRSRSVGGHPELHIGPATHLQWWPQAQKLMLRFFDRNLKMDRAPLSNIKLWDINKETWITSEKASPLNHHWALTGNGLSSIDQAAGRLLANESGSGEEQLVHDPWRPVPSIGGHLSPNPGIVDRSKIDLRNDILTFTTDPFRRSIQLAGIPSLKLKVKADQPGLDICLALSLIPSGSSIIKQLSTGFLRLLGENVLYSKEYIIPLQPLVATFNINDRLRLSIAASAWPAIGINPGHSNATCGPSTALHRVITMKLKLAGSELRLNPLG